MKLIIGLGNPGEKYLFTRHNLGFLFLNFLQETWNFPSFEKNEKFQAQMSKNNETILIKPQTFMNLSGEAVRDILKFYKLTPGDILVIHDDIDIDSGKYKIVSDSSSAGHNGIKDIIEKLGTQEFQRVRIGIKNDQLKNPLEPADFVLQNFSEEELEKIKKLFPEIEKEIVA